MLNTTISVNEYGFYCVPDAFKDRDVPKILAAGKVYEPKTLRLIRNAAGIGDVISGGAFVGDFFPAISRALADKARLYSFEPNPISFEAASQTIALNGLSNVMLDNRAVGAAAATMQLQTERSDGTAAAAGAKIVQDPKGKASVPVEVTTLDEMIPKSRKISVLHLDVEGHEIEALQGAERIITDSKPLIILEAGKSWQARALDKRLQAVFPDKPYRFAGLMERNAFFVPG